MTDNTKLYLNKNLQIIFGVTLMAVLGVSSISPVLPKISQGLGMSEKSVVLLIVIFTMPGVFLSPLIGILADRFNRKIILIPSLFVFGIAGALCAFTKNYNLLLLLRFIQGLGAASFGSLNLTIIGDLFTGNDRVRAMGYNASVLSFGTMLYPVIGGFVAHIGWNYPFLLSLLAIPVGFFVLYYLDNPEPVKNQNIKEYFTETIKTLKNIQVIALYLATLSSFILLYGVIISYFPFFMHKKFHSSPSSIGLILSSASIVTSISALNLVKISNYFSPKKIIVSSFIFYCIAIYITIFIEEFILMIVPVIIYGFANGINIPTIQMQLSDKASLESRGAFMSINSMILRLGQTIGPLLAGIAYGFWEFNGVIYSGIIFSILTIIFLIISIKEKND